MLHEWDGIVFDLDGTLVRLVVPWNEVDEQIATIFRSKGFAIPDDGRIWSFLHIAENEGFRNEIEAVLQQYEIAGAKQSKRLPLLETVEGLSQPVGVCSLNCEQACDIALTTHGIAHAIDTIVGRDSLSTWKPDPEPLQYAIDTMELSASSVVFIGDSVRDEETAAAAGVDFRYVKDLLSNT